MSEAFNSIKNGLRFVKVVCAAIPEPIIYAIAIVLSIAFIALIYKLFRELTKTGG